MSLGSLVQQRTERQRVPGVRGTTTGLGPLGLAVIGAVALLVWAGANGFRKDLLAVAAFYSLMALGMYVPFVMAGSLSLAYAAYAGIGGYAVALVDTKTTWPVLIAWVIGPAVAAVLAVLLGLVTRRLSGFYLAAVTLLFSRAFQSWLTESSDITGGSSGLGNFRGIDVFGWSPSHDQIVIAGIVIVCLVGFGLDRLRLSPWGVTVRSMREVPQAVEATGVRVPTMALVALGIGAAIGAVGGALFASSAGSINPDTVTLNVVFLAIFMPIIGGSGTPWGAVVGAIVVVELTLNFSALATSGTLLVAIGVLAIMLVAPRGILGYADSLRRRLRGLAGRSAGRG